MADATKTAQRAKEPDATEQSQKLPDSAMHTVSHMLGEIVWLMSQSPRHKHFSLADLEWMVMPALVLRQYRLFHDKGIPIGVAFWAFLSEEAESKISFFPSRLRPDEWKSGSRCWVVDIIIHSAADNRLIQAMLEDLKASSLKGQHVSYSGQISCVKPG